jgi:lipopolysaccharide transport system ATP-binding protein
MERSFDQIAAFAEIGSFMDQPVKTFSSGMFMRLAFAVAVNVNPDILLVDEALAVGDLIFQHRCMHRMNQLRGSGKTIVLVTRPRRHHEILRRAFSSTADNSKTRKPDLAVQSTVH